MARYEIRFTAPDVQQKMPNGDLAVWDTKTKRSVSVNQQEYQRWYMVGGVPVVVPYLEPEHTVSLLQAQSMLWEAAFPGMIDAEYQERKIDDYAKLSAMMMVSMDEPGSPRRNAIESLYAWQMSVVAEYERRKAILLQTYEAEDRIDITDLNLDFTQRWDGSGLVPNPSPVTGDIWVINALSATVE